MPPPPPPPPLNMSICLFVVFFHSSICLSITNFCNVFVTVEWFGGLSSNVVVQWCTMQSFEIFQKFITCGHTGLSSTIHPSYWSHSNKIWCKIVVYQHTHIHTQTETHTNTHINTHIHTETQTTVFRFLKISPLSPREGVKRVKWGSD